MGKNLGRRPEKVRFPTPAGVGGENGYFLALNGLKSGGYILAKKGVFWDPTCKGIFGGPVFGSMITSDRMTSCDTAFLKAEGGPSKQR